MIVERNQLLDECNKLLRPELFRDYGPNGLQVEGRQAIGSILSAVTASQAAVDQAIALNADALLVHHGVFWGKGETRLTGTLCARVKALLGADINLLAWHLPLDAHPDLGNNAQLARLLEIRQHPQSQPTNLVAVGEFTTPLTTNELLEKLQRIFGAQASCYGGCDKPIRSIGWCTGAGGDFLEQAAQRGIDAFLTGEVSERHYHLAQELGVCLFAGGHHATERYGVQALGNFLAQKFSIHHQFFDQANPL